MNYDTATLRQFINEYFGPQDLNDLLFDYFRSVHEELMPGMTKRQHISLLLEFCDRHGKFPDLLAAIRRERDFFQPENYMQGQTPSSTAPLQPAAISRKPHQVFISHAHQDAEVAHKLAHDLKAAGFDIWIAPESILPGEKWVEAINRGLEESGLFILLLSPDAVASRWVKIETNVAISLTHEDEIGFYPLMLKTCRLPPLWRAFQQISLRGDYAKGFAQLLGALEQKASKDFSGFQEEEEHDAYSEPMAETVEEEVQPPIIRIESDKTTLAGTLSIETLGGVATPIIDRGAPLPAEFTQTFSTAADNQTQVEIHLVYGERPLAADNVSLGKFIFDDIPPAPRGVPQIKITVQIDTALKLTVKAEDEATGKSKHHDVVDLTKIKLPEAHSSYTAKSGSGETNADLFSQLFKGQGSKTRSVSQEELNQMSEGRSFSDFFDELFGQKGNTNEGERGNDLFYDLTISFDEAIQGTEKSIAFERPQICSACQGSGKGEAGTEICSICNGKKQIDKRRVLTVRIPAGVKSGSKIRLRGEGTPGQKGGAPGNLYLVLSVQEHEFLVRNGKNVFLELPIQPEQAKKGGKIEVPTAYGWSVMTIPPGTKHGDQIILPGKGTKALRQQNEKPGDQIVWILVTLPDTLSSKSKHLFDMTNKSYKRSRR